MCKSSKTVAMQAVPVYLSEMAPSHLRGALNIMFQLATTTGMSTSCCNPSMCQLRTLHKV